MLKDAKENPTLLVRPQAAFAACLPEMQRLLSTQIQAVNLDVMEAVRSVRGRSDRLSSLRAAAEGAFKDFKLPLWDKLETYTFALIHAHESYLVAVRSCAVPADLVNEAQQKFELLYAVAQTLVSRHLLESAILKSVKGHRGRLRYAYGSLQLVQRLREVWPMLGNKTGLTEDELTQAELAAERLASGIAKKNEPKERAEQLANMRDRAFTLFIYAYGQVRRAVQYLRWDHNDADVFAPSLYRRRHTGRAKARRAVDSASVSTTQPEHSAPDQHQDCEIEARVPEAKLPTVESIVSGATPTANADTARRKRAYAKRKSHESVTRFRSRMRQAH